MHEESGFRTQIIDDYRPSDVEVYYHFCTVCQRMWGHEGCSASRTLNYTCPACSLCREGVWAYEGIPIFPNPDNNQKMDGWW